MNKKKLKFVKKHNFKKPSQEELLTSLSPANANAFVRKMLELKKVSLRRSETLRPTKFQEFFKDRKLAQDFVNDVWKQHCEELNKDAHKSQHQSQYNNENDDSDVFPFEKDSFAVPDKLLTKKRAVPEFYAKKLLENYKNEFDIEQKYPFIINTDLVSRLVSAPKKVIAETQINGIGDHGRPCYIIRQLLECSIDEKKYLMISDIKLYNNNSVIAAPLILIKNGYPQGEFPIARIDLAGRISNEMFSEHMDAYNKLNPTTPAQLPKVQEFMQKRFGEVHTNIHTKTKSFPQEVSQEGHLHTCQYEFSLLNTFNSLKHYGVYNEHKKEFTQYNAYPISFQEYYDDDYKPTNNSGKQKWVSLEEFSSSLQTETPEQKKYILETVIPNNGVIPTADIIKLINKRFNMELTPNRKFLNTFDAYRQFYPTRTISRIAHSPEFYLSPEVTHIPSTLSSKLEQAVENSSGKIVDEDYIRQHPELQKKHKKH